MSKQSVKRNINAPTNKKQLSPELEEKMRVLANLIIDRIFEDRKTKQFSIKQG